MTHVLAWTYPQLIRRLAVALAIAAVTIGAVAVFTSGYTAGQYVHDLVLLVLALAVLALAHSGGALLKISNPQDPDDQNR